MLNNISVQLGDTALLTYMQSEPSGPKTVSQIWAFYANIDISHHGLLYDLDMESFKWPLFFSQIGDKISNLSYSQLKEVHIVVPFAYLSSSYSKFEWAGNAAVQARTK